MPLFSTQKKAINLVRNGNPDTYSHSMYQYEDQDSTLVFRINLLFISRCFYEYRYLRSGYPRIRISNHYRSGPSLTRISNDNDNLIRISNYKDNLIGISNHNRSGPSLIRISNSKDNLISIFNHNRSEPSLIRKSKYYRSGPSLIRISNHYRSGPSLIEISNHYRS